MEPTNMLQKFIQDLWARYRTEAGQAQVCLQIESGDQLVVEEEAERKLVKVRYLLSDAAGNRHTDLEVHLYVDESGVWIPFEFHRAKTGRHVYGTLSMEDGKLTIIDAVNQEALVAYCDAWSFYLRDQKWLQHATLVSHDDQIAAYVPLWPEPTEEEPDLETLEEWFLDSICEATDGCIVEHDGVCPHGHPAWLLRLGLI